MFPSILSSKSREFLYVPGHVHPSDCIYDLSQLKKEPILFSQNLNHICNTILKDNHTKFFFRINEHQKDTYYAERLTLPILLSVLLSRDDEVIQSNKIESLLSVIVSTYLTLPFPIHSSFDEIKNGYQPYLNSGPISRFLILLRFVQSGLNVFNKDIKRFNDLAFTDEDVKYFFKILEQAEISKSSFKKLDNMLSDLTSYKGYESLSWVRSIFIHLKRFASTKLILASCEATKRDTVLKEALGIQELYDFITEGESSNPKKKSSKKKNARKKTLRNQKQPLSKVETGATSNLRESQSPINIDDQLTFETKTFINEKTVEMEGDSYLKIEHLFEFINFSINSECSNIQHKNNTSNMKSLTKILDLMVDPEEFSNRPFIQGSLENIEDFFSTTSIKSITIAEFFMLPDVVSYLVQLFLNHNCDQDLISYLNKPFMDDQICPFSVIAITDIAKLNQRLGTEFKQDMNLSCILDLFTML